MTDSISDKLVLKDERPTSNILKDERPTSNIERPTSNEKQILNEKRGSGFSSKLETRNQQKPMISDFRPLFFHLFSFNHAKAWFGMPAMPLGGLGRMSLVPMLLRGNPYGIHSHAGAWEREKLKCLELKYVKVPKVIESLCSIILHTIGSTKGAFLNFRHFRHFSSL